MELGQFTKHLLALCGTCVLLTSGTFPVLLYNMVAWRQADDWSERFTWKRLLDYTMFVFSVVLAVLILLSDFEEFDLARHHVIHPGETVVLE